MRRSLILAVGLLILTAGLVDSSPTGRKLLLNVISPPLAYSDSRIDDKLVRMITAKSDIRVSVVGEAVEGQPAFPVNYHDLDSLMEWGREAGARYLMVVEVTAERMETRKSFHVPLVFHKYEAVGIIEGEFRLLDLSKGRLLAAEPFKVERKGPRIFQATMDDDVNDPDLHLTAPGKIVFFDRLEESLCQHLAGRVRSLAGR